MPTTSAGAGRGSCCWSFRDHCLAWRHQCHGEARQRGAEILKSAHQEALLEVQYAGIKHTDATSWTRGGKLMSLWTLASTAATVYQIFVDGCRDTIRPLFGPRIGILVSDRATVFSFWAMEQRQICHAHNADLRIMPTTALQCGRCAVVGVITSA